MAKHVWSVLCKTAILDLFTNSASLINVFDEIKLTTPEPLPTKWNSVPFSASLVTLIARSDPTVAERCEMKIEAVAPTGEIHPKIMTDSVDLETAVRARMFSELGDLPVHGPGTMRFVVSLRANDKEPWTQVGEASFELRNEIGSPTPSPRVTVSVSKNASGSKGARTKKKRAPA